MIDMLELRFRVHYVSREGTGDDEAEVAILHAITRDEETRQPFDVAARGSLSVVIRDPERFGTFEEGQEHTAEIWTGKDEDE